MAIFIFSQRSTHAYSISDSIYRLYILSHYFLLLKVGDGFNAGCFILEAFTITTSHTSQLKRDVDPMLVYFWPSVEDGVPTVNQHWINVSFVSCLII